ncbi:MAG: VIT1/CCC1 family protein [Varibaculum sp.]|nr:VIT1/CCC1 family protein [Varibaculum sp.]
MSAAMTTPGSQPTRKQIRRWRRYLAEERLEADTYRHLARTRTGVEREIFEELAAAERRHESYWEQLLGERVLPAPRAPLKARLFNFLARNVGSIFVLAMMQGAEERTSYDDDADATAQMAADEHIHSEVVRALAARQRSRMAGSFRASVFGMNDGLVSTCALILGVMGTGTSKAVIVAAGFAGLLAGALSMGAGEYISVHSQRELLEASDPHPQVSGSMRQLDINANELALVYRARGMDAQAAEERARSELQRVAGETATPLDGTVAVSGDSDTLKQATTSTDSHEEIGTGLRAGTSSFLFFALGAAVPVLPFLLRVPVATAAGIAIIVVGICLLITGGIVGLLSGAHPLPRALRQLLIGYGAAGVTFLLGRFIGGGAAVAAAIGDPGALNAFSQVVF